MWPWETRFVLVFASSELEALFQVYDAASNNCMAGVPQLLTVTLYYVMLMHMYGPGAPYRNLLPPLSLPSCSTACRTLPC